MSFSIYSKSADDSHSCVSARLLSNRHSSERRRESYAHAIVLPMLLTRNPASSPRPRIQLSRKSANSNIKCDQISTLAPMYQNRSNGLFAYSATKRIAKWVASSVRVPKGPGSIPGRAKVLGTGGICKYLPDSVSSYVEVCLCLLCSVCIN